MAKNHVLIKNEYKTAAAIRDQMIATFEKTSKMKSFTLKCYILICCDRQRT